MHKRQIPGGSAAGAHMDQASNSSTASWHKGAASGALVTMLAPAHPSPSARPFTATAGATFGPFLPPPLRLWAWW